MHERYMKEALLLAQRGTGLVHPNPLVGSVLVLDGKVIGEGFHERCGGPHAEVNAIADAKKRGYSDFSTASLYVTLEPCSHHGKTPPCADLIIKTGIGTVITGMSDPNPLVSGRGIERLRQNGIKVTTGILEAECRELNHVFIKYITTGLPFVLFKSAMSLDGKIATSTGESKWISGEESRRDVHRLRSAYTAIMCGIDTVLADDPTLDVRLTPGRNPIRIIADSSLRIPVTSRIVQTAAEIPTVIATLAATHGSESDEMRAKREYLTKAGLSIVPVKAKNGRLDLVDLITKLGAMEIDSILLEGGGTLAAAALAEGIIDRIRFYLAPLLIGGHGTKGPVGGTGISSLAEAFRLERLSIDKIGDDLIVEGTVCSPGL